MNFLRNGRGDIKEIFLRIKKRDYSGNTGLAIKNSIYQISTNIASKFGSLIFSVILARLMMPELFGLYNLALSTILIFAGLSDLGMGNAVVKFLSSKFEERDFGKAKGYLKYLWRLKAILLLIIGIFLFVSAGYISKAYNKPISMALVAGALYVAFYSLTLMFVSIAGSLNRFRNILFGESLFQISRIILVPLAVFISLKYSLSNNFVLFYVFLALSFSYVSYAIFLILSEIKKLNLGKIKTERLSENEKKAVNTFLLANAATAFSGIFFGFIDRIVLGLFVDASFIGYYTAAISLVTSLAAITGISSALFPIFSRLNSSKAKEGLKKSLRGIFLLSLILFAITIIFAPLLVWLFYGEAYLSSVNILRFLAPMVILTPIIGIYSSYFLSKGKPWIVSGLLIGITAFDILLNYILIKVLITHSQLAASYGSAIAVILSQLVYILGLFLFSKKKEKSNV